MKRAGTQFAALPCSGFEPSFAPTPPPVARIGIKPNASILSLPGGRSGWSWRDRQAARFPRTMNRPGSSVTSPPRGLQTDRRGHGATGANCAHPKVPCSTDCLRPFASKSAKSTRKGTRCSESATPRHTQTNRRWAFLAHGNIWTRSAVMAMGRPQGRLHTWPVRTTAPAPSAPGPEAGANAIRKAPNCAI